MIQDAESFGFVENVTDTMKFMKFFLFSFIIHVLYLSGLKTSQSKIHLVHPVSSRRRVFVLKIFIDRSSRPNESLNRLETMKHGYKS
jgi:hypothetical protein